MLDASLFYRNILQSESTSGFSRLKDLKGITTEILDGNFVLATVHRAENTDDIEKLSNIISAFNDFETNVIFPLHPRTKKQIAAFGLCLNSNIHVIDPVGYFEMLELEMKSVCIITDSGGIQKEAYFLKKPCITLREQTEWVETLESGWNILVGSDKEKIMKAFSSFKKGKVYICNLYGRGNAGEVILSKLSQ
jgi:UDP-GlcNAc3NAcA epimerase